MNDLTLPGCPAVSPQKEDKVGEREVDVDVLEVEQDGEQRGAGAQVVLPRRSRDQHELRKYLA